MCRMEGALDLQRKVQQIEAILHLRQEEVSAQRNANAQLITALQRSQVQEADLTSQLLAAQVQAAQLNAEKSQLQQFGKGSKELLLVQEVAGLKSRLSNQQARHDKLRARCAREVERLAYFKKLMLKTQGPSDNSTEVLLQQVNERIQQQRKDLDVLDLHGEMEQLETRLAEKQEHLAACKKMIVKVKESKQLSKQKLELVQKRVLELQQRQAILEECQQHLQHLSQDCQAAAARLAGCKEARAAAHAQHAMLQDRIGKAKWRIFQLIG